MRASELTVNCAYFADGGSQGKVCARGDDNCIPGCGRWCDPGRGVFNWGCAWKPEHLKQMIVQQMQVHPDGGYNEIIIDSKAWRAHGPLAVEAIFGHADIHRGFIEAFPHLAASHPLMELDPSNWREPMRLA